MIRKIEIERAPLVSAAQVPGMWRKAPWYEKKSTTTRLGTGLGTSRSVKTVRAPSEATPGKRDMVFDFISHNPKVVGSNPTPATMGLFR